MGRYFVAILVCIVLLALPYASAPQRAEASAEREFLVIGFDNTLPANLAALVSAAGGTLVRELRAIGVAVVRSSNPAFAATLGAHTDIAGVALDLEINWLSEVTDLDSLQVYQPSVSPANPGPTGHLPAIPPLFGFQWNMARIEANLAWLAGFQGVPAVKVAILDTGIDPGHVDTAGRVIAALSANFTPEASPPAGFAPADFPAGGPFFPWLDYHFHGTHVAGIVAANGVFLSGVARHASLIAVKVLNRFGSGTFGGVISGIVYAADVGADIINMSLGATFPRSCVFVAPDGTKTKFPSQCAALLSAMNRAVNYASSQGTLVISAAGNSAVNADRDGNRIWVPAQSGNGVAVSATGPVDQAAGTFDNLAFYSNYGHSIINVAGPGGGGIPGPAPPGNILDRVLSPCSRYSTFGAPATFLHPCRVRPAPVFPAIYLFARGTSMSAPAASGVAALIDSNVGGAYGMAQLRSRLQRSSDDLGKTGADPIYGHGRVNAYKGATGP